MSVPDVRVNVPMATGAKGRVAAALEVLTSSDTVSSADLDRVRTLLRDASSLLTTPVDHPLPRSPAVLRSPRRTMRPAAVVVEYVPCPARPRCSFKRVPAHTLAPLQRAGPAAE